MDAAVIGVCARRLEDAALPSKRCSSVLLPLSPRELVDDVSPGNPSKDAPPFLRMRRLCQEATNRNTPIMLTSASTRGSAMASVMPPVVVEWPAVSSCAYAAAHIRSISVLATQHVRVEQLHVQVDGARDADVLVDCAGVFVMLALGIGDDEGGLVAVGLPPGVETGVAVLLLIALCASEALDEDDTKGVTEAETNAAAAVDADLVTLFVLVRLLDSDAADGVTVLLGVIDNEFDFEMVADFVPAVPIDADALGLLAADFVLEMEAVRVFEIDGLADADTDWQCALSSNRNTQSTRHA